MKPPIKILKKTMSTSPAVYLSPPLRRGGQLSVPSTQMEPYQKPRAYEERIEKKRTPSPRPRRAPCLAAFLVTLVRVALYFSASKGSPLSCLTVLIDEMAC